MRPAVVETLVPRSGKKTLTVRLSLEEKAQAEAVARYLNLPVTTFLKFAAKEAFNSRLPALQEAGLWPLGPQPSDGEENR
jgi:hypothetical protein